MRREDDILHVHADGRDLLVRPAFLLGWLLLRSPSFQDRKELNDMMRRTILVRNVLLSTVVNAMAC